MDLLYDKETLAADLETMHQEILEETSYAINEGDYHQGNAVVIRVLAVKR